MKKTTPKQTIFRVSGSTGGEHHDMLYSEAVASKEGSHFTLLVEHHHQPRHIEYAKDYLRRNFDVVSISTIKEDDVETFLTT